MAKQKAIVQVKPKTNLYLVYVRMMMSLGILAAAGLIVANILIIIRVAPGSDSVDRVMQVILRIYAILLSLLILWACFQTRRLEIYLRLVAHWTGLGMVMIFTGVLTLGTCMDSNNLSTDDWVNILRVVAGWIMTGVGVLYSILGLFGGKESKERAELNSATNLSVSPA